MAVLFWGAAFLELEIFKKSLYKIKYTSEDILITNSYTYYYNKDELIARYQNYLYHHPAFFLYDLQS